VGSDAMIRQHQEQLVVSSRVAARGKSKTKNWDLGFSFSRIAFTAAASMQESKF
jgi:hypothetical protein